MLLFKAVPTSWLPSSWQTVTLLTTIGHMCICALSSETKCRRRHFLFLRDKSIETRRAHSPARASKNLSRSLTVPSPPWEGARCLREQCKLCVKSFIGFLRKPRSISLFLFYFLIVDSRPPGSSPLKDLNNLSSQSRIICCLMIIITYGILLFYSHFNQDE